ncbi:MAG: AAA family ATPase [Rhodothermales bacterium]|nr:AAA family ATPase [Rhodothermales bacterium]
MIRRVHIKGYKSLQDVEIKLQPLTVLVGPNAAGKSNFLDALQLLSRTANPNRRLKAAFESPYRGNPLESFSFGPKGIEGLLEKGEASFSIEVDVELSDDVVAAVNQQIRDMRRTNSSNGSGQDTGSGRSIEVKERFLRYRLEIEILPKEGFLRVSDEYLAALRSNGELTRKRKPFLEREGNHLRLRLEGQGHPRHLDLFLDYSILSTPLYAPHYPHLVAMQQELARWFFYYFEPRERMRAPNPVKEVRHIGLMGEELASFLNTLRAKEPRQFKAVEKALKEVIPSITGIHVEVDRLGQVELRLLEGDVPIPSRLVSEGTLRVLGLLALSGVQEAPSLLGFEEPENGIAPDRIELIARYLQTQAMVGKTQLIVTTHSPLLGDLMPHESLYVCKKEEGRTRIRPLANSGTDLGPLSRRMEVSKALKDPNMSVSERMVYGDLDA